MLVVVLCVNNFYFCILLARWKDRHQNMYCRFLIIQVSGWG